VVNDGAQQPHVLSVLQDKKHAAQQQQQQQSWLLDCQKHPRERLQD
jgi:hypothetical protein